MDENKRRKFIGWSAGMVGGRRPKVRRGSRAKKEVDQRRIEISAELLKELLR